MWAFSPKKLFPPPSLLGFNTQSASFVLFISSCISCSDLLSKSQISPATYSSICVYYVVRQRLRTSGLDIQLCILLELINSIQMEGSFRAFDLSIFYLNSQCFSVGKWLIAYPVLKQKASICLPSRDATSVSSSNSIFSISYCIVTGSAILPCCSISILKAC